MDGLIYGPEHALLAVDNGESGYVMIHTSPHRFESTGIAWDFTILTEYGKILGVSDFDEVYDNPFLEAGGPVVTPKEFSFGDEAMANILAFLCDAAEKYFYYDMPDKINPEGDLPFNLAIREWCYQNQEELSALREKLDG